MGSLVETEDLLNNISFKTQYDLINRVTGVTSSDGGEYRISYDDQNRIDATLEKIAGVTLKNEYQYSNTSIIEGIKLNGSQILTYDWDDLTRMTSRTLKLTAPFTTQYTYLKGSNAGGETTLVAEIKNGGETLRYAYDQFGNITSVSQNGAVVESYEYDGLNQLTKVTNGANVTEYAYDAGGNLTSVKLNGEVQDTYGYTDAGWKDLLTSFNGQAITYDEIGNPLTYRDGFAFTWQNGRRLASISHGDDSISYTYDPDGIRTSKTVNGTTTKYHVMNGTLLGQTKGSDTIVFLYDEKGNKYGFDYNGTKYYYIFNVQGDVIGILNQAGQKIVSYTYDPWGKVLSVDGSEASTIGQINPIRYRSYYYDTETGFYYLQSRYYDPKVRRFLNADGILGANQDLLSYNLFAYCSNDPVNFCDPTGCYLTPYERLRVLLASGKAWYDAQGKLHIPYSSYRFMSKKRTNRPDSGLADLPDEEISRRARDRSLSGPERNKYREEEKVRGLRNKQKRKNYKRIDKDITDPHYFDLEPYPGYYDDHETNSSFIVPGIPGVPVFPFVPVFP